MKELYEKLRDVSDRFNNLDILLQQKEEFIKKWDRKDEVPFMELEQNDLPIVLFFSKEKALEAIDQKITYNVSELEKSKLAAIKEMQRLIEEWTLTR